MIVRLFTWLCVVWFRGTGWKIPNDFPEGLRRYVLVVAPHTSNVDFFVGVAERKILGLRVKYIAKKELFAFPFKRLLLNLGGVPVDRSKRSSLVDQVAERFATDPDFAITVTPEGTRSRVAEWKTGFYHMARTANVPVILVGFDYREKWVVIGDPIYLSDDKEGEIKSMQKFAMGITPRHPRKGFQPDGPPESDVQ